MEATNLIIDYQSIIDFVINPLWSIACALAFIAGFGAGK